VTIKQPQQQAIDYTSAFHVADAVKVIGLYGCFRVTDLEIHLAEFTAALFLEVDEPNEECRTQSLSLLQRFGWQLQAYSREETTATSGQVQIRL